MLNESKDPGLCIQVQQRYLCVSTYSDDTAPNPDRSAEIPTLIRITEGLRFPEDLGDRSTWFRAEQVFG
jgi:hypothetical protein